MRTLKLDVPLVLDERSQPGYIIRFPLRQRGIKLSMRRSIYTFDHGRTIRLSLIRIEETKNPSQSAFNSKFQIPSPQRTNRRKGKEAKKQRKKKNSPIPSFPIRSIRQPNPMRTRTLPHPQRQKQRNRHDGLIQRISRVNKRLIAPPSFAITTQFSIPRSHRFHSSNIRTHRIHIKIVNKLVLRHR